MQEKEPICKIVITLTHKTFIGVHYALLAVLMDSLVMYHGLFNENKVVQLVK
jgi:hypothetical protein